MKMCQLKSGIVLKDRIFMPDYDSHSTMLEELGITDDYLGASKKFVRVELSPENGDVFSNIDEWKLKVDQDIKPDWFSEEEYKPRIVEAVKEWAKKHIHIGVDDLKITEGENHFIKDCKNVEIRNSTVTARENSKVTAWGNSKVTARENSTVTAWENSTVTAWGNSKVTARENSTVTARENSTVTARENSTVTAWENSKVTAWENSTVTAWGNSKVTARENSTVTARENSTVTAWENSKVTAWGNSKVTARENSTVTARENSKVTAWGNSTVTNDPYWAWYKQNALILSDNATFKDKIGKVIYQSGDYKLISVESGKTIGEGVKG